MTKEELITALQENNISFKEKVITQSIELSFDNNHLIVLKDFDNHTETCTVESRDLYSREVLSRETMDISEIAHEILQY